MTLSKFEQAREVLYAEYGDSVHDLEDGLRAAQEICHSAGKRWWYDIDTGAPLNRNKGELICLMHSELSEAMEGERKNLMDEHLPHRRSAEVEISDCLIRILDYAGGFDYDIVGAVIEKLAYNKTRLDHTNEHRLSANGKKW